MYVVQPEREMKLTANKNRASLLSGPGTSNHNNIQMSNIGKIHPYRNNKNAESVNDALKPDDFLLSKCHMRTKTGKKRSPAPLPSSRTLSPAAWKNSRHTTMMGQR